MNEPKTSEDYSELAASYAFTSGNELQNLFRQAMLQAYSLAIEDVCRVEWLTNPERFKILKLRDSKKLEDF